jgi:ubiquinone/menaquinone biosynthesis C-methylase UbiE
MYDWFYGHQKRHYDSVLDSVYKELDLTTYENIVDVGCGTGALCSVLNQRGLNVTGIDQSEKMLGLAMAKQENNSIEFLQANVLERLPFKDKTFDVSIASFVAHGLKAEERKTLYAEMSRITRHLVIIYDYNQNRSILVNIIEWLEGGDYFNFIKMAEYEMKKCFPHIRSIDLGVLSTWYVCDPPLKFAPPKKLNVPPGKR